MAEKECIEREAAIAVIEEKQKELCPVGMYSRHAVYGSDREKFDAWQEIIETLESIPAADVRPVVLCKDCGHWNKENQHQSKRSRNSVAMCAWFSRNYGTIETSDGDWCSYGYRREES